MPKTGCVLAVCGLLLSGCLAGGPQTAAPSSRVAALAAAASATAVAPTGTPIVLPTATPGPTSTAPALPAATSEAGASAGGSPQLAPRPSGRPNAGPASQATAVPPAVVPPASAAAATATPQPLPTLPPGGPQLVPAPPPDAGESAQLDERSRPLVERASALLAGELGIAVEAVTLVLLEAVIWPDGGLGCAQPGQIVQPVETPGYRILLAAAGGQYEYHSDMDRQIVRCNTGQPRR